MIPILGLLISFVIWLSLQAAIQAMYNCKKIQNETFKKDKNLYFKELKELLIQSLFEDESDKDKDNLGNDKDNLGNDKDNLGNYKEQWIDDFGLLPPKYIPLFFFTAWLFIFLKVLRSYFSLGLLNIIVEFDILLFVVCCSVTAMPVRCFQLWKKSKSMK